MKHDKVFIIPEKMDEVIPNNPNQLPWKQSEAFIGVPLFADGKAFAHFGMIWSKEGADKRPPLSWGYIEMCMHSLEDIIKARILEGRGFAKEPEPDSLASRIIPLTAITASQSLKPYARSLSHELRTPMQGVIGLLDVMHYTVMDAMEAQEQTSVKDIFLSLKDSIEKIQDSSKRAVEAADNVVHAYDNNMEMPDTPLSTDEDRINQNASDESEPARQTIMVEGSGIPISAASKRLRDEPIDFHPGPPMKRLGRSLVSPPLTAKSTKPTEFPFPNLTEDDGALSALSATFHAESIGANPANTMFSTTHRHLNTREFLRRLVNDAFVSLHPVEKLCRRTEHGEVLNIKMHGAKDDLEELELELHVQPDVPHTILAEEQHLQFVLQKVIDNAIKFTVQGKVTVLVNTINRNAMKLLEFRVIDTGCGIMKHSRPYVFKPHYQEDNTISRRRDGLGLSLYNAKVQVRKDLGGDMLLGRSETEGPNRGSEFLIHIPLSPSPDTARPETPLVGTPKAGSRLSRASSPVLSSAGIMLPTPPTSVPKAISPPPQPSPATPERTRLPKKEYNRALAKEIPLNILVAEDNAVNRRLILMYLDRLGYKKETIIEAADGLEAVARYSESLNDPVEKRINCILMDLWMPNMDGYKASESILALAHERGIGADALCIIAVTADITNGSIAKAETTGLRGFISKPFKIRDLETSFVEYFGKA